MVHRVTEANAPANRWNGSVWKDAAAQISAVTNRLFSAKDVLVAKGTKTMFIVCRRRLEAAREVARARKMIRNAQGNADVKIAPTERPVPCRRLSAVQETTLFRIKEKRPRIIAKMKVRK